ncbi:succinylglutamate desuccinylase/aspartoacylase family protein [Candidatus Laterigemmans baculatus]|uniref:succinylglutamate desuccinylase/aspartoacylase family protein n=1 Tax=Candidatus Laterigemmans baculatus TaxID=2770505 RepID=UPI0013DBA64F|nr:succinylglutamate desuccinylase/aspartoacylase family protein [Candidatus Laterigemmans baculatus]
MTQPLLIQSRTIQGASDGPHLLITGGVHGDEFEPMAALRRLLKAVDGASLRGRLTVVPVANEAAYWRGARTAEDELDLARTCPGSPDGSITERIAHALSELIRAADYYVDLHTGGVAMSVLPLVGYTLIPDEKLRAAQRRMAEAFNLPLVWGTDYRLQGRTLSVARDAGVPAIYAEYHGSGLCDPAGIDAYLEGCLNVMGDLGMLDRDPPASRVERVVEDARPAAGHMQVRNLAPMDGFFEPQLRLGDRIEAGQPLGTIADVLGENVVTVNAHESGTVIVLRTFSRVRQGDSLAVVLEDLGAV